MITAGSGRVASMTIYLPHVAVQHSSGCPKDMGMCIVQAGTILGLMWTLLMQTLRRKFSQGGEFKIWMLQWQEHG